MGNPPGGAPEEPGVGLPGQAWSGGQLPPAAGAAVASSAGRQGPDHSCGCRPGHQPTVHCRGTGGPGSEGFTQEQGLQDPPLSLDQIHTTAVLIQAILAGRLQVATPFTQQALPTAAAQLAGGAGGS